MRKFLLKLGVWLVNNNSSPEGIMIKRGVVAKLFWADIYDIVSVIMELGITEPEEMTSLISDMEFRITNLKVW